MAPRVAAVLAAAVLAAVLPATAAAQRPDVEASALVYPGAEAYQPELKSVSVRVGETLLGLPGAPPLLASRREDFLTTDKVEQVDAYYKARLRAVPSGFDVWAAIDPRKLAPGSSTPVHSQRYTEFGQTNFLYHWWKRERNEDVTLTEVLFLTGYSLDPKLAGRKSPGTMISVTTKTFSASAPSVAPSEEELGAPLYPGAVYDSHGSQVQLGQLFLHRFLTADAAEKVVAFYESALARKAMQGAPPGGGVSWNFVPPLSAANPDDWASIESLDRPDGSFRTAIVFHLTRFAPDERPQDRR